MYDAISKTHTKSTLMLPKGQVNITQAMRITSTYPFASVVIVVVSFSCGCCCCVHGCVELLAKCSYYISPFLFVCSSLTAAQRPQNESSNCLKVNCGVVVVAVAAAAAAVTL